MKSLLLLLLTVITCLPSAMGQASVKPDSLKGRERRGMSVKAYQALTKSHSMVLIDFYADWCGPCKRMEPFLREIEAEMGAALKVIRINADDNTLVCNELSVYALPTLFLYKGGRMYWFNTGYTSKEELFRHLH